MQKMKINITYEPIKIGAISERVAVHELLWNNCPQTYTVPEFPLKLDIELTNRCSRTCDMCAFHSKLALFRFPNEDLPLELFKKIIDESEGKTTLKLNYSGDPLLYPHLTEAIEYAKKKGVVEIRFNTSGDLLTGDMMKKLIKAGLDRILLSDYDDPDLKEKILTFEALKQLMGVTHPIIVIQKVMAEGVIRQEWIDKWSDIETIELGLQTYLDYQRMPYNTTKSGFQCAFPWQRMLILSNGDVYTCCGMPHRDKLIGNIVHDTIKELWHGNKMESYRKLNREKRSDEILGCACCPMRDKFVGDGK